MSLIRRIFIFTLLIFFAGCGQSQYAKRSFVSMGTIVNLTVENSPYSKEAIKQAAGRIKELDAKCRDLTRKNDTQVYRALWDLSVYLNRISGGAFDVTLGDKEGALDFKGVAKGYIVDKAIEALKEKGVKNAIIDAGGDIFCLGDNNGKQWTIGIKHPNDKKNIIAKIKIKNKAVATSGGYERPNHIIDPQTTLPVKNNVLSATVISDKCAIADGLATALFVLKPEDGLSIIDKLENTECIIIYEENGNLKFYASAGIKGRIEIL